MSDSRESIEAGWDDVLDAAIMNLLGELGRADVDGLLHVLKRERIRIDQGDLSRALARLSKSGRISVDLDDTSHNPVVRIKRPFVGWT